MLIVLLIELLVEVSVVVTVVKGLSVANFIFLLSLDIVNHDVFNLVSVDFTLLEIIITLFFHELLFVNDV
jgi:hypothetical protein